MGFFKFSLVLLVVGRYGTNHHANVIERSPEQPGPSLSLKEEEKEEEESMYGYASGKRSSAAARETDHQKYQRDENEGGSWKQGFGYGGYYGVGQYDDNPYAAGTSGTTASYHRKANTQYDRYNGKQAASQASKYARGYGRYGYGGSGYGGSGYGGSGYY